MTQNIEKIKINEGELILLVSLNKSFNQKEAKGVYVRPDLYEATRQYWVLSQERLNKISYVLGIYKGIVQEVIEPTIWFSKTIADDGTVFKKARFGCEGIERPESQYMNKSVADYPFGRGGAVRYITSETK